VLDKSPRISLIFMFFSVVSGRALLSDLCMVLIIACNFGSVIDAVVVYKIG
jgi:hypothetical protein